MAALLGVLLVVRAEPEGEGEGEELGVLVGPPLLAGNPLRVPAPRPVLA